MVKEQVDREFIVAHPTLGPECRLRCTLTCYITGIWCWSIRRETVCLHCGSVRDMAHLADGIAETSANVETAMTEWLESFAAQALGV